MFLINGLEQESLPASDRATQFGDGCFTTARIADGDVCLLDAHIRRLQTACKTLMIPFTQWDTLRRKCASLRPESPVGYSRSLSAAAAVDGVIAVPVANIPPGSCRFLRILPSIRAGVKRALP